MISIKDYANSLNRKFESRQTSFYSILLVFMLGFILLGLYPLYKTIAEKTVTLNDLIEVNVNLKVKREMLQNIADELNDTGVYVSHLRAAIPDDVMLQSYVVSMSEVASASGYKQQRLVLNEVGEDQALVSAQFLGVLNTFPLLVDKIESLDRLTEIKKIELSMKDNQATVKTEQKIWFLK